MRKRILILTLTMVLAMLVNTVPIFASARYNPPTDPNNPQLTVEYGYQHKSGEIDSYLSFSGNISGKVDINGRLYDSTKDYTLRQKVTPNECWFVDTNNNLYKMSVIEEIDPLVFMENKNTYHEGRWVNTYELIPTKEKPSNSSTLTVSHSSSAEKIVEHKYIVNGSEVTKDVYESKRNGAYKERTSTEYVEDIDSTLENSETTFIGLEEHESTLTWSDGIKEKIVVPEYKFKQDDYYKVRQRYLTTHDLEVVEDSTRKEGTETADIIKGSSGSAEEKILSEAECNTPKVMSGAAVKMTKVKAAKKSAVVRWKKISKKKMKKIKTIEVQYSTDKTFSNDVRTKRVNAKKTSAKIKRLKSNQTYYVRIRAYRKAGGKEYVSAWSGIKAIKVR